MPNRPSRATDLFEKIKKHEGFSSPAAFLNAMVNSTPPTFEDEYLDFKAGNCPDTPHAAAHPTAPRRAPRSAAKRPNSMRSWPRADPDWRGGKPRVARWTHPTCTLDI
jgi:hypothetical protein